MTKHNKHKIRHSKLRNTGILFELLVRQITTDTLNNKDSLATSILKKYFNSNEISREFKIYNTLSSTTNISEAKAQMLIESCVEAHKKLNKANLKKQKYELISEIKANYNIDEFFKTKVSNYKTLASIYMLFETVQAESIDENKLSEYKFSILESISAKPAEINEQLEELSSYDKGTRSLIYHTLLQKFNEKYKDLDVKQRKLLKEYINNISTSDKLKEYVNKEISTIRDQMKAVLEKTEDEARKVKIQEITSFLKDIPENKNITEQDVNNLLYYYELIREYEKI